MQQRDADGRLDLVGHLVERRGAQQEEVGAAALDALRGAGEELADLGPALLVLQRGQLGEVDGTEHELGRRQAAEALLHPEVEVAVVDRGALPAHPAHQADRLHVLQSVWLRARATAGPRDQTSRCTLCCAAWARGLITISSMFTCEGRGAIQAMASATSSATRGSATPAYPASALARSPSKRTIAKPSVRTMAGAISLIRIGSPTSSRRRVSVTTWVPCLAAV